MTRLYCLHCRHPLSVIAEERQRKDGRILCLVCRKAEAGQVWEEQSWSWWGMVIDLLVLGAMVALVWAMLAFLD